MPDIPLPKPSAPQSSPPQPPQNQADAGAATPPPTPPQPPSAPSTPSAPTTPQPPQPPGPPKPSAPPQQQNQQLPPASLSALSSMSSTALPPLNSRNQPQVGAPPQAGQAQKPGQASSAQPQSGSQQQSGGPPLPPRQPQSKTTTQQQKPSFAKPKRSILRFLPFVVGLAVLGVIGYFGWQMFFGGSSSSPTNQQTQRPADQGGSGASSTDGASGATGQPVVLEYWGLWEPTDVMQTAISDFESQNPGVSIRYTKQSHRDYRERLENEILSGTGPDIFRFHASWVPMLSDELAAMPSSVYSTSEFQEQFYPVASRQLRSNGQLVGVPLMYDGLGLYYNMEIFETANVEPPQTWTELRTLARTLTLRQGNTITRGGIALGNATNVEHFSDILGLLMLQNGADLRSPNSQEVADALEFYTDFMSDNPVWSEDLPPSSVAFARGDVAMIFAPSWRAHEIMTINPDLKFGVVQVPTLADERIGWANYWAEGVNNKSAQKDAAWKFLEFLSSPEVLQKLYSEQSQIRAFGELYPRPDMANELASDPLVTPFLQDAPDAQSWYLNSNTFDNGINDQIITYYEDAITGILEGQSVESTLNTLELGTTQILRRYNATGPQQ